MTSDEIIAKWSGMTSRERDAWVEEVVFGAKIVSVADDDDFHVELPSASRIIAYTPLPRYTKDISAAWAVVDRYYSYRITRLNGVDHYRVVLHDEDGDLRAYAHSSSAPEAIGFAAIIAELTEEGAT